MEEQIEDEFEWRRQHQHRLWSEMTKAELEEEVKWRAKYQEDLWERVVYLQECYNQKSAESKEKLDTTKRTLHETTSRLLQLRTHADGLEQNVHDMHKEIEKLKDDVKKRDSTIKAQMTYIENLHELISK